jgi:ankyrin repeat protein
MIGGLTPLHFGALLSPAGTDGVDELLQLVAAGHAHTASGRCDVVSLLEMLDEQDSTALHRAVTSGNVAVLKRLLAQPGCKPNVRGVAGRTPLHCAVLSSSESVEVLLEHPEVGRAGANIRHDGGLTTLHFAAVHARSCPAARASLGVLLASIKVDTSLTAVLSFRV